MNSSEKKLERCRIGILLILFYHSTQFGIARLQGLCEKMTLYDRTDDCIMTTPLLTQWGTASNWAHLCAQYYSVCEGSFTYPQLEWLSNACCKSRCVHEIQCNFVNYWAVFSGILYTKDLYFYLCSLTSLYNPFTQYLQSFCSANFQTCTIFTLYQ